MLNEYVSWPDDIEYELYLQGSYRNSTNIRGDSDVDLVAQLNSAFHWDISQLIGEEQHLFLSTYTSTASYGWSEFRQDVLSALRDRYGWETVSQGNKSIKVRAGSGRLPADVVVCVQHRRYLRFRGPADAKYVEGMAFWVPRESRWVVNYPKLHYENGVKKNSETNGWYKPTIRLFKNARSYLMDHGVIPGDLAHSYFVECLLYNVPSRCYGSTYQDTFLEVLSWLSEADPADFACQNEQVELFGTSPEQWACDKAVTLIAALQELWREW